MEPRFSRTLDYWGFNNEGRTTAATMKRIYANPGLKIVFMLYLINDLGNSGIICFLLRRVYYSWAIRYGIGLPLSTMVGRRLRIFHWGNVFINSKSVIGNDVTLMQGVTIGNTMKSDRCPVISDHVFVGAGAMIIGDVFLAKGVRVGANSVVTRSCNIDGATLVGVPANLVQSTPTTC